MQLKRGKSADWTSSDLVLAEGQPGVEYDSDGSISMKVGNGVDLYKDLPYVNYHIFKHFIENEGLEIDHLDLGGVAFAEGRHYINIGSGNTLYSYYGMTLGDSVTSYRYQLVLGQNNVPYRNIYYTSTGGTDPRQDSYFIVGNGEYNSISSNSFRIGEGEVYGSSSYNSSGADYSEMFEWEDGNPNSEDRIGLFVTLSGNKIRLANSSDSYILGVISATPAIVGDSYFGDIWHNAFMTDVYGRLLLDNDGKRITNSEYDPTREYIPRDKRKEWDKVGLIGKLVVNDDGTCEVGSLCKCSSNGVATKSNDAGYYVMERLDSNHIRIMFK